MYMLIGKSVANVHLFFMFWRVSSTLVHIPFMRNVTKIIIISNYSYNKICDEHTVDMLFTFEYN
jgi:hypothetical protein